MKLQHHRKTCFRYINENIPRWSSRPLPHAPGRVKWALIRWGGALIQELRVSPLKTIQQYLHLNIALVLSEKGGNVLDFACSSELLFCANSGFFYQQRQNYTKQTHNRNFQKFYNSMIQKNFSRIK